MDCDESSIEQRLAAGRVRLLQRVAARRRARRAVVTAAVVLIAGTGAVATLGAGRADSRIAAVSVTCFTAPDLHSGRQVVAVAASSSSGTTHREAEQACGRAWGSGDARAAGGAASVVGVTAAVCRLLDGTIGVFPVRGAAVSEQQLCDHLDLTGIA